MSASDLASEAEAPVHLGLGKCSRMPHEVLYHASQNPNTEKSLLKETDTGICAQDMAKGKLYRQELSAIYIALDVQASLSKMLERAEVSEKSPELVTLA